jgi:hypothetical protein
MSDVYFTSSILLAPCKAVIPVFDITLTDR